MHVLKVFFARSARVPKFFFARARFVNFTAPLCQFTEILDPQPQMCKFSQPTHMLAFQSLCRRECVCHHEWVVGLSVTSHTLKIVAASVNDKRLV